MRARPIFTVVMERPRVGGVERSDGFEPVVGAGPGDGEAASHAEADDSQAAAVDGTMVLQKIHSGVNIVDDGAIAQTGSSGDDVVFAIRSVAMVKIRRHREISFRRRPRGHLFHKLIDSVLMLDHHDRRQRLVALRPGDEQIHPVIVYANLLMICLHR